MTASKQAAVVFTFKSIETMFTRVELIEMKIARAFMASHATTPDISSASARTKSPSNCDQEAEVSHAPATSTFLAF